MSGTTAAESMTANARLRAYAARRLAAIEAGRPTETASPVAPKSKARKDRRTAAQRAADVQREARRASWARMHPDAAAAERALRKGRAQTLDTFRGRQATPETLANATRRNEGALARLYRTGAIDVHQLNAANDIASVAARITAGVTVRTANFEGRVDRSGDGTFHEALGQVRREVAYGRWRYSLSALRGKNAAPAVLEMIVGDARCDGPVAYTIVAAKYRMGARRAKALLIAALDLWMLEVGDARRTIRQDDLDRAHARLLG